MQTLLVQSILDGLLVGGVYSCIAVGLSLSLGVMRIFNWAQGDLLMVALYFSVLAVRNLGVNPYVTIIFVLPIMFIFGYVVQKFLLNAMIVRAKEREPLSVLIATAGLSYVLANLATLLFTSNSIAARTKYTGTSLRFGDIFISEGKVIAFLAAIAVTILLQLFLYKTEYGRALRATSQDREVAALMGMNNMSLYNLAVGCQGK